MVLFILLTVKWELFRVTSLLVSCPSVVFLGCSCCVERGRRSHQIGGATNGESVLTVRRALLEGRTPMLRRSQWIDMACACLALIAYLLVMSFATLGDWTWGWDSSTHTVEVTPQQAQIEQAQIEQAQVEQAHVEQAQIENRQVHLTTPP
jgi:hypothetical protein